MFTKPIRRLVAWFTGGQAPLGLPTTHSGLSPDLAPELASFLTGARETTFRRIQYVNDMSSREILRAGEALEQVVREAQAQVGETQQALTELAGTEGQQGIPQLAIRQTECIREYLSTTHELIAAQEGAARNSEQSCSQIAQLGVVIQKVASQARLLALNARIEAARLGSQGAALSVIASEMVRLSDEVGAANRTVSTLTTALLKNLPAIAERASTLRHTSDQFSENVGAELEEIREGGAALETLVKNAVAAGDERVKRVVLHSYEALSHLQFQDTCAQRLLSIDAVLKEVADRVEVAVRENRPELLSGTPLENVNRNLDHFAGDVAALTPRAAANDAGGTTNPGEILLF